MLQYQLIITVQKHVLQISYKNQAEIKPNLSTKIIKPPPAGKITDKPNLSRDLC